MTGRPRALLVLATSVIFPGCGESPAANPQLGVICFVMIRRDALGLVKNEPVSPDIFMLNDGRLGIVGKITRVTDRWLVVVSKQGEEFWIPREAILCVMQRPGGGDFGGPFGGPESPIPKSPPPAEARKD